VYAFDHRHELPHEELRRVIGGKAASINVMATRLGLPVPPGFTISTAACMAYLDGGWPDGIEAELRGQMARVERAVGSGFGDATDPLLVSVRSGAPVSMPGMMDTILNLGLNEATERGLARSSGEPRFAADCRARFTAMYRAIVGVEEVPDDPWEQLRGAVQAVFRSWNSTRARAYRAHEGIPDDLGTAVTVQAMVFGNRGPDSGTGVVFTRNPASGEATLYGDVMFEAQGEDVVAGDHHTEPIGVLDARMPQVADELRRYAATLERHYADLCDIEFTIDRGKLWLLQVRVGKRSPQAALRIAAEMAEEANFPVDRSEAVRRVAHLLAEPPMVPGQRPPDAELLATGLAASPGIACGEIVTDADAAVAAAEQGRSVILVRGETSPDDVHGMARAAGILTASGGLASHAAVVARGWGLPAVVGADAIRVEDGAVLIGDRRLSAGELITIDGTTGEVLSGAVSHERTVVPEASVLAGWARELDIDVGIPRHDRVEATQGGQEEGEAMTEQDVLRALLIKGYATPEMLGACLFAGSEQAASLLDRLAADGLVELAAGSFRLSADGKAAAAELVAADRDTWGSDQAVAALDRFLELDARMKQTVTDWQMREVDGEQQFNDHADADYDRSVLDRLADLHADALAWLRPLEARLARLGRYEARLDRAAGLALNGDPAYVASPRVDSYHTVWFELHEELIHLAGRTRAQEVAAGRA
jgi:pyruvate,orthophosphate dikinase